QTSERCAAERDVAANEKIQKPQVGLRRAPAVRADETAIAESARDAAAADRDDRLPARLIVNAKREQRVEHSAGPVVDQAAAHLMACNGHIETKNRILRGGLRPSGRRTDGE